MSPRSSYRNVLEALAKYREIQNKSLTTQQMETLNEISHRIHRLDNELGELLDINNELLSRCGIKIDFDSSTDTIFVRWGDIIQSVKLQRADSNVPIQAQHLTSGGAYQAGAGAHADDETAESLKLRMESLLEQYYYSAHRVLKLIQTLPNCKRFECREITIIRNKLIEHPKLGESYSFGYSNEGPTVRPAHHSEREWIDKGLMPNTQSFVDAMLEILTSSAS